MKNNLLNLVILSSVLVSLNSFAASTKANTNNGKATNIENINKDFDSLGGNQILLDKAAAINPEVRTQVVQNRIVDRSKRFEFSGEYANTFGGDTYVRSGTFAAGAQYHINNNWSLGARYGITYNKLTPEGNDMVDKAAADYLANPQTTKAPVPDIDYPKSVAMAFVNYYPLYGKMSWLGRGITHFDIYGQLGYGTMELNSGNAPVISGGLGMGAWLTQNLTARVEARYMDYTAQYYNGPMKQGITSASLQIGWLL